MSGNSSPSDWSTPEIVRTLNRLSEALERFEESVKNNFRDLDSRYVSRDVYERDLAAVQEHRESARSWIRELVAPLVASGLVGFVLIVIGAHWH